MEKLLLDQNEVISLYDKLKNIHKVAEKLSVSISPIKRILKSNNIDLSNRRYELNDTFFDEIDSEKKAYWLGFLYADGYIRERKTGNSLELKLSTKDLNHIEQFKLDIKSNHRINFSTSKVRYKEKISTSSICGIALYSNRIVESIKKHGVVCRKTFIIQKPDIATEFNSHFIRGYFDGDGSFSFNPEKYIIKTQIVSASEDFQNFIIDELKNNDISINRYSDIKLQIQKKVDNLKFYKYIYKDAHIYLDRKKQKYEQFRRYYGYDC